MKSKELRDFQWNVIDRDCLNYFDSSEDFSPKVAIIDSGIDKEHHELAANINLAESYNFLLENDDINDETGHGTMTAGVLCASQQIQGYCPTVELYMYKITNDMSYKVTHLLQAINRAIKQRVHVINLSLSIPFDILPEEVNEQLRHLFQEACDNNIAIVIAAGNKNKYMTENINSFYSNVYTAGALSKHGVKSSYSNYGEIDFLAPGGDWANQSLMIGEPIITCYPTYLHNLDDFHSNLRLPNGYTIGCGTSLAASYVTGVLCNLHKVSFSCRGEILNTQQLRKAILLGTTNDKNLPCKYGEIKLSYCIKHYFSSALQAEQ